MRELGPVLLLLLEPQLLILQPRPEVQLWVLLGREIGSWGTADGRHQVSGATRGKRGK